MIHDDEYAEAEAAFEDLFSTFGFTARASGGLSLGDECAGIVVESIAADAADGVGAEGQTFPENSAKYRERKQKRYGWTDPGRRTGQMLSIQSLKGSIVVDDHSVEMTYGTGEPPNKSTSPTGYLSKSDEAVSDRDKLGYVSESFGDVYAMNQARVDAVADAVGAAFARFARIKFAGGGE